MNFLIKFMKTSKLYHYIIIVLFIVTVVSCDSSYYNEPENEDSESTQNNETEKDYTPNSIVGKIVKIDSETRYFDFTSSGSCSASCSTLENVYGTPQYSYSRTNGTQAKFWAKYVDKRTRYNEYSKNTIIYYRTTIRDYTFTFTSESGGKYSGILTIQTPSIKVGTIVIPAETSVYSPKGSFSIY